MERLWLRNPARLNARRTTSPSCGASIWARPSPTSRRRRSSAAAGPRWGRCAAWRSGPPRSSGSPAPRRSWSGRAEPSAARPGTSSRSASSSGGGQPSIRTAARSCSNPAGWPCTTPAARTRYGWRAGGPARSWPFGAAPSTSPPPDCTARWSAFTPPAKARGCCCRGSSRPPSTSSTRPAPPSRASSATPACACCPERWPRTATSRSRTRPIPCAITCWPTSTGGWATRGSREPRSRPPTACRRAPSTASSAACPGR